MNPGAARVNIITSDSMVSCWPSSPHFPWPRSSAPCLHPSFLTCHLHLQASQPLLIPTGAPCPPGPCPSGMPSSFYLLGGKSEFSSPMSQARLEFSTPTGQTAPPAPPGPSVRHCSLQSQRLPSSASAPPISHQILRGFPQLTATLQGVAPSQDSLPQSLMNALGQATNYQRTARFQSVL